MPAGIGLGLLAVALWRLACALGLILARSAIVALRVAVWTASGLIIGAAWLLERTPRPRRPDEAPDEAPDAPTLGELLAPYGRREIPDS
jgi:hypothetical protein